MQPKLLYPRRNRFAPCLKGNTLYYVKEMLMHFVPHVNHR